MIYTTAMVLLDSEKIDKNKGATLDNLRVNLEETEECSLILYIDEYGNTSIIKNRYGKEYIKLREKHNERKLTGLKDSYGNDIKEGDTIVWTYKYSGLNINGTFIGCLGGNIVKEFKKEQVIKYEIRDNMAGYFLDVPHGMGIYGHHDSIKYVIKQK